jgi:hypothetical protein
MSVSSALDVAIGLAFLFFLFSLVVSGSTGSSPPG